MCQEKKVKTAGPCSENAEQQPGQSGTRGKRERVRAASPNNMAKLCRGGIERCGIDIGDS